VGRDLLRRGPPPLDGFRDARQTRGLGRRDVTNTPTEAAKRRPNRGPWLSSALALGTACQTPSTPAERPTAPPPEVRASEPGVSTPPRVDAPAPPPPAPTATCPLEPGERRETITVGTVERTFELWVGPRARGDAPLLLLWHGWGGDPARTLALAEPETYWADAIVVAPRGLPRSFDAFGDAVRDGWQIAAGEAGDRDLALFDALVERFVRDDCVDPKRIYASGFSNGGYFSNLLGCVRGRVVAAIAPAGGGGPWSTCEGDVAVTIVHGRRDDVVAFAQGERTAQTWARHKGCPAALEPPPEGCTRLECERAPLEFCAFDGGHRLPRGQAEHNATFLRSILKP